jgi:Fic family protein
MQLLLEQANQALGRLDGLASVLPDLSLFIYAYVRKEAVLSSQIEGTQSSLSDLMLFENDEAPGVPLHDVQEVSNYVAAINHGLARLRGGFPLSLRLIRELTRFCWPRVAEAISSPANSGRAKTGLAAPVPARPHSCHHRRIWSQNA